MTDVINRLREQQKASPSGVAHRPDLYRDAADEIERLRGDLALLGPVTTPCTDQMCASCVQPVSEHWTYCPYCGAQGRLKMTGEKL